MAEEDDEVKVKVKVKSGAEGSKLLVFEGEGNPILLTI